MVEKFVMERYNEIVEYLKVMKFIVVVKVKEVIFYLNVIFLVEIKGRYVMMKDMYDEIEKKI